MVRGAAAEDDPGLYPQPQDHLGTHGGLGRDAQLPFGLCVRLRRVGGGDRGLAVGVAKKLGYASPEFALSLAMAGIVMYDAMGVRRAAGEQAKVLNKMVIDFKEIFQMLKEEFDALARGEDAPEERGGPNKRLKEFLGHTPLEVLCGAALGILIAALIPAF